MGRLEQRTATRVNQVYRRFPDLHCAELLKCVREKGIRTPDLRRQGADQHVVLAVDLADLCLFDAEVGGRLSLRQTGCSAYCGQVDH